jgi:hypothetical protein
LRSHGFILLDVAENQQSLMSPTTCPGSFLPVYRTSKSPNIALDDIHLNFSCCAVDCS